MLAQIYLPVYNNSFTINDCLSSVLPQLSADIRLYIQDDKSTDGSVSIINDLIQDHLHLTTFVCNTVNRGLSANLHDYLMLTTAEYVFRMDADDIALPNRFLRQLSVLLTHPQIDLLGGQAYQFRTHISFSSCTKKPTTTKAIIKQLASNPFIHPTVAYKAESIRRVGNYNPKIRFGQDYELWFRCAYHQLSMHNMDEPLIYLRLSPKDKYTLSTYYTEFCMGIRGSILCRLSFDQYILVVFRFIYYCIFLCFRKAIVMLCLSKPSQQRA